MSMSKQNIHFSQSYPALMTTPIWEDDATFKLYYFLLYKATHKEPYWNGFMLSSNELVISRQKASAQLHWSIHKYQRHLLALEELGIIVTQRVSMGTKIKIMDFLSADDVFISEGEVNVNGNMSAFPWGCDSSHNEAVVAPYGGYDSSDAGAAAAPNWSYDGSDAEAMAAQGRGYDGYDSGATAALNRDYDEYNAEVMSAPNIDIYKNNKKRNIDTVTLSPVSHFQEPEGFRQLWLSYPVTRRTHREEAARLFREATMHGATLEAMMTALEVDKCSEAWLMDGGKYIPGIVKWLQKETWHDYLRREPPKEDEEHWVSR